MSEQSSQFAISPLTKGIKVHYSKDYKRVAATTKDMKIIVLASAIRWGSKRGLSCQNNQ
jgi:hypothetical protein